MTQNTTTNESTEEPPISPREQRELIRQRYGTVAEKGKSEESSCCGTTSTQQSSCCGDQADSSLSCGDDQDSEPSSCCNDSFTLESHSERLGYTSDELEAVAEGANLGLGCGNPNAIANLNKGEIVLDLGSGGGFDCFLAAHEVGEKGSAIGIDMTPEMIERARENVEKNDMTNVEFRLGEIENLPVSDEQVDVIISNCVINLSPDKHQVFEEAYRVLRPGGRLAITDVVMTADVPVATRADPESVAACVAGASTITKLEEIVESTGFESVSIRPKEDSDEFIRELSDEVPLEEYIISAVIEGKKPHEAE